MALRTARQRRQRRQTRSNDVEDCRQAKSETSRVASAASCAQRLWPRALASRWRWHKRDISKTARQRAASMRRFTYRAAAGMPLLLCAATCGKRGKRNAGQKQTRIGGGAQKWRLATNCSRADGMFNAPALRCLRRCGILWTAMTIRWRRGAAGHQRRGLKPIWRRWRRRAHSRAHHAWQAWWQNERACW